MDCEPYFKDDEVTITDRDHTSGKPKSIRLILLWCIFGLGG